MSSDRIRFLLAAAATATLAACNTANTHLGDEDPGFGEAVKYDQAIQTANPMPVYSATAAQPGGGGAKAEGAMKRYRTDTVKSVENTQTSTEGVATGMSGSTPH